MKRFFLMIRKAFPDLHYVVEEGIAEGTEFHGRRFSVPGVNVFSIRNCKITEVRCFWDTYSQMQQLHWVPLLTMNCA